MVEYINISIKFYVHLIHFQVFASTIVNREIILCVLLYFFELHSLFLELSWKGLSDHRESSFILWWKPKDPLELSHDRCFSIHQQFISLTYRHAHPNTWTYRHDCYSLVATLFLITLFIVESTSISTRLCFDFLSVPLMKGQMLSWYCILKRKSHGALVHLFSERDDKRLVHILKTWLLFMLVTENFYSTWNSVLRRIYLWVNVIDCNTSLSINNYELVGRQFKKGSFFFVFILIIFQYYIHLFLIWLHGSIYSDGGISN